MDHPHRERWTNTAREEEDDDMGFNTFARERQTNDVLGDFDVTVIGITVIGIRTGSHPLDFDF